MGVTGRVLGAVTALLISSLVHPDASASEDARGVLGPPPGVAIDAGAYFSLVVADDGLVYGTGWNEEGQLTGTDDKQALTLLRGLPFGVRAIAAAAGDAHSLVVVDDGLVYGTGNNYFGELTGTGVRHKLTPLTGLPTGVRGAAVSGGSSHTLVVADDGLVYGTGYNEYGQLTGTAYVQRTLTPLSGLPDGVRAIAASAGIFHSLVVADDGLVYGTGLNDYGQLTGTADVERTLTPLSGLPDGVRAIVASAGYGHSLVVADDGLVYGTGWNDYGELTGTESRDTLTPLTGLPVGVRAIAAATGYFQSLVLADDGLAYGSGANNRGQLTGTGRKRTLTPLTGLPAGARAIAVAFGEDHSLVLADDGLVYGTGSNYLGELTGSDDPKRTLTPLAWGFVNTVRPRISGAPRLGRTLTAHHGTWWPVPASYTYRWYRNGTAIKGATGTTHRLVARDLGTKLTVKVTAKHPGYQPTPRMSKKTATIRRR